MGTFGLKRLRTSTRDGLKCFFFREADIYFGGALAGNSSRPTDRSILVAPFPRRDTHTSKEGYPANGERIRSAAFAATNDKLLSFSSVRFIQCLANFFPPDRTVRRYWSTDIIENFNLASYLRVLIASCTVGYYLLDIIRISNDTFVVFRREKI